MMSLPWPRVWAGVAVHIVFTTYEGHKSSVRSLHLNYNLRQWLPTLPRCRERSWRFQRNLLRTEQCQMWSFAWMKKWCMVLLAHFWSPYFIPTFISGTSELNWPSETESLIRKAILSGKKSAKMILSCLWSAVLVWAAFNPDKLKSSTWRMKESQQNRQKSLTQLPGQSILTLNYGIITNTFLQSLQ